MEYNIAMAYVGKTFQYMGRAFWALALVCLPAAIVLGIFTVPMASLSYFVSYASSDIGGFTDMFWLFFSKAALRHVYPLVLILLALIFSVSLALSVIEKHFRVGKLMLLSPLKQINNYILPLLATFSILTLILCLYGMVQTGVLTLLHFLVGGKGAPGVLNLVLAAVISTGLFVLSVFAACSTMYWTPMMVIYGFSFRDAAASSLRLIDRKTGGILLGLLTPFLIVAVLANVVAFIPNAVVCIVLGVFLYLFLIMYIVTYIMVSMFDLMGMERRDAKARIGGRRRGI
ncbi:MAG: hypothetical protein HFE47_07500 [Clostridia bacterium]|nr:hypothetical protein [Clostridia bacterium]